MTRKEFEESKEPLVYIVSLDPITGKVLYDTYSYDSADGFMEDFKKDFPQMIHFRKKNKAAGTALMKSFGFSDEDIAGIRKEDSIELPHEKDN